MCRYAFCMESWRSWIWLIAGSALGSAVTLVLIRASNVFNTPAWWESVAWQGWVGSLIGALVGALVAGFVARAVLKATLEADSVRMAEQLRMESKATVEQKRIETWAELMSEIRRYFAYPVDVQKFSDLELRTTAAFYRWSLYMPASEQETVDGVRAAMEGVIGSARAALRSGVHGDRTEGRTDKEDLVANLVEYGNMLHRHESDTAEAVDWFRGLAREWAR